MDRKQINRVLFCFASGDAPNARGLSQYLPQKGIQLYSPMSRRGRHAGDASNAVPVLELWRRV
jgi:hypothetical protein